MAGTPIQMTDVNKQDTNTCRGSRGSGGVKTGMIDNPIQLARLRSIIERQMEKNPAFQPILVQLDSGQLGSPRDLMRALALVSQDSSSFRALANEIIQIADPKNRNDCIMASIFQEIVHHRKTMTAERLSYLMDLSKTLSLNSGQTANLCELANKVAEERGFGSIDENLNTNFNTNVLSQPTAEVQQTTPLQTLSQNTAFEFENDKYNKKTGDGAFSSANASQESEFIGRDLSSHQGDLTNFIMTREAQAKASGPLKTEFTTLERAALNMDKNQDSIERTMIAGQDKPVSTSESSKSNDYMIDLQSKDPIERLKFYFANLLGMPGDKNFDDKSGPDTLPKGPPSCPPIVAPSHKVIEVQAQVQKPVREAVILQPMEPLTFRLRQGRFVTASSLALDTRSLPEKTVISPTDEKDKLMKGGTKTGLQINPKKTTEEQELSVSRQKKRKTAEKQAGSMVRAKQKADIKKRKVRKQESSIAKEKKEQRKKAESDMKKSRDAARLKSASKTQKVPTSGEKKPVTPHPEANKKRPDAIRSEHGKKQPKSTTTLTGRATSSRNIKKSISKKEASFQSNSTSKARPNRKRNENKKRTIVSLIMKGKKPAKRMS